MDLFTGISGRPQCVYGLVADMSSLSLTANMLGSTTERDGDQDLAGGFSEQSVSK